MDNGGKWRNSEAQRGAAFVGVRNKRVCKGMRRDTEERLQLQMVGLLCRGWAVKSVKNVKCAVRSAVKDIEGKSLTAGGKWRAIAFETRGVYCVE